MPRLQIDVTDKQLADIETLMQACGFETKKELFNNALTLLYWAVNEVRKGNTIASVNEKEEKYRELQMPGLQHAATPAQRPAVA